MKKLWSDKAWDDYTYWQSQDKKTLKRINSLLKSIERDEGTNGGPSLIGKPERLRYSKSGLLSVRIDSRNRLVYKVQDDCLYIISCKGHYE